MVTQTTFVILLVALVVQRLVELRRCRRNTRRILARGGREHAAWQMPVMKGLHTAWFLAMVSEVFLLDRAFLPELAAVALVAVLVGQTLRISAIRTLGWRWTTRVLTVPGAPTIQDGVYRYVRHPNYLGVALEIAAVPMLHGAWLTAVVFSVANGLLMIARIRAEERALSEHNGYDRAFGGLRRFIPGPRLWARVS